MMRDLPPEHLYIAKLTQWPTARNLPHATLHPQGFPGRNTAA